VKDFNIMQFSIRKSIALYFALLLAGTAMAQERILSYHSDIKVHEDASLMVTETIRVQAEGVDIRRGIYRDFPTRYKDRQGNHHNVEFQIVEVRRNGQPERYFTENRSNGIRVYIGNSQVNLVHGEHEYRLLYRTTRQLGFFSDFDELYWNVTGNGWMFSIDQASAQVELPSDVAWDSLRSDFYTGLQGERGQDADFKVVGSRTVEFRTTGILQPRQGFTIALGWPKGIVHEPTFSERLGFFLKDNGSALVLFIGLILPLGWYLRSWHNYGRDPVKGVIIPRFEPPPNLSAAACRYVIDMGLNSKAFTAAIVSLGVKGYLKIDEQDKDYSLYREKGPKHDTASAGEAAVLEELLPESDSWIELDDKNYREFLSARNGLKKALKAEHHSRLFKLNTIYMLPAIVISILAVVFAISREGGPLPWVIFIILTITMHIVFLFLLRAPTPAGRLVMDQIEGLKMYLNTAEQFRLDRMRSPELTPEVFEMFLPYAFALGVENNWCERFALEFPKEIAQGGRYSTSWYSGNHSGMNSLGHIGTRLSSSLSSAVSSASSPPGSSSGGGGGGSSGGGGGGGGGGGW
jgi:uncharacterized membrane protein YgcG